MVSSEKKKNSTKMMEVTRRLAIPIFNFSKDNLKNFISKEISEESIFTSTVLCSSNSKDSDRHDKYLFNASMSSRSFGLLGSKSAKLSKPKI